jgi:hypothetical protein
LDLIIEKGILVGEGTRILRFVKGKALQVVGYDRWNKKLDETVLSEFAF